MIKFIYTANDLYEAKYQLLINKQESTGLNHLNDSKAFIEYLNDIFIKILKSTIKTKKSKILITFDMVADMLSNKNLIQ